MRHPERAEPQLRSRPRRRRPRAPLHTAATLEAQCQRLHRHGKSPPKRRAQATGPQPNLRGHRGRRPGPARGPARAAWVRQLHPAWHQPWPARTRSAGAHPPRVPPQRDPRGPRQQRPRGHIRHLQQRLQAAEPQPPRRRKSNWSAPYGAAGSATDASSCGGRYTWQGGRDGHQRNRSRPWTDLPQGRGHPRRPPATLHRPGRWG
mmetsp:Transcript_138017/g.440869  ORF Transcript_138017/g.440869 Transcript_138017/m.440869 type:complete len:205 (+) Transcript_138017:1293-1907(+)